MRLSVSQEVVTVAARSSPLSQAQVKEVLKELQKHVPEVTFSVTTLLSHGDIDKQSSLRNIAEKSDFFTREIDEELLQGRALIAIHSAKDLPAKIPEGLTIIAITKGVDPSDSLVVRDGEELHTNSLVATSSLRREQAVSELIGSCQFTDIRGTIGERLAKLDAREVDAVVVAEAALIRLGLTGRTRFRLPGLTTPFQGQLAILARVGDSRMAALFAPLDTGERP